MNAVPEGMRRLAFRVAAMCTVICAALATMPATPLAAQVIRGQVTEAESGTPLPAVLLTLQDSTEAALAQVRTDAEGRFQFTASGLARFRIAIRKVGAQPSYSGYYDVPENVDTLVMDLAAPVTGVTIATVTVIGKAGVEAMTSNESQLALARKDNWQIVEPWRVAKAREQSVSLEELLRRVPLGGVRMPEIPGDCFSSKRDMRRPGRLCLNIVVDGILLDPGVHINPMDVHFVAFVPAMKARVLWGPRAFYGAIYIATRKQGDDERRPGVAVPPAR